MKKLILGLLIFIIPCKISAQTDYVPNLLEGIWQYLQANQTQHKYQHLPIWKVMGSDSTFKTFIIADSEGKSVITNEGTYSLASDSVFIEHITGSITDRNLIGKDNLIKYHFEGNDTIQISYRLPEATTDGKETWVRVRLEKPE